MSEFIRIILSVCVVLVGMTSCSREETDDILIPGYTGDGKTEGSDTSGEASDSFQKLVSENVNCSASFSDYFWTVRIESKLESSVTFTIGHTSAYDTNCTIVTSKDSNVTRTTQSHGNTVITTIREPFYFYYLHRNAYGDKDYITDSQMYLSSYEALKSKENSGVSLTNDEKALRNDLVKYLDRNLAQISSYAIYVFASSDAQRVSLGKYIK